MLAKWKCRLKHLTRLGEEVAAFTPELARLHGDAELGREMARALDRAKANLRLLA